MTEILGPLAEIPDGKAKGYPLADGREVFVVRQGERAYGYFNVCPHIGARLNWQADDFLTTGGELIICTVHGALFEIETGECLDGPPCGRHLAELSLTIDADGRIVADPPPG